MSNRFQFASKEEKLLFDFLKDGAKEYNQIISYFEPQYKDLKDKGFKISTSTINRILKENEGKRIFRIEKDGKVFYRLNDFPYEIQLFFAFADSFKEDTSIKFVLQLIKNDIIRLYPKLTFKQILSLWKATLEAITETKVPPQEILAVLQRFKETLE